jgi:hypothetical protein
MPCQRAHVLIGTLLATSVFATAAIHAQTTGYVWDGSQLPTTKGTVRQYTLTPRGDVDGLVLTDGTEVKLPPHLSTQTVFAIHPSDVVTIHGLKARALPLVDAVSITNDATGATIADSGPPAGPGRAAIETTLTGKIAALLHGKRGEVNGALLDNGAILRLPPPEADRMQAFMQPGAQVAVRGASLVTPLGTVVDVAAMGSSPDRLTELRSPPPAGRKGIGGPKGAPPR